MGDLDLEFTKLKTGDTAPYFVLWGVDEAYHDLNDTKGKNGTLIIFMCNTCPAVTLKVPEIKRIARDFKSKGIAVIGINVNESLNYPEDSFEKMQEYFQKWGIDFYYLHDDAQTTAKHYGAICTPDPFFFDKNLRLIFHSRIDDTHLQEEAGKHEMYDAIDEYLKIGEISQKEQPSMGCSIKWRYDER